MHRYYINLLFIIVAALLSASCGAYHPQMLDMPLIQHKGDGHLDAGLSTAGGYSIASVNASASYGLTNHIAVQAAGNTDFGSNSYLQGALGWFKPVGEHFVVEIYAGYGHGQGFSLGNDYGVSINNRNDYVNAPRQSVSIPDNEYMHDGRYSQYFVQGNAGFAALARGHIDLGMGIKIGSMAISYTETDDYYIDHTTLNGIQATIVSPDITRQNHTYPIWEQQIMLRVGGERLKYVGRIGLMIIPGADFDYTPISVSSGINFRF